MEYHGGEVAHLVRPNSGLSMASSATALDPIQHAHQRHDCWSAQVKAGLGLPRGICHTWPPTYACPQPLLRQCSPTPLDQGEQKARTMVHSSVGGTQALGLQRRTPVQKEVVGSSATTAGASCLCCPF